MPPVTDKPKKDRYEDHLKAVEDAVRSLEEGKLDLEDSIERYESGMRALNRCREILGQMEKRIEQLVQQKDGSLVVKPLETGDERPARPAVKK